MSARKEFADDFDRGFKTEDRFIEECKKVGLECKKSSEHEDMKDHFDCVLTNKRKMSFKVDVKGLKKISRSDPKEQEDYHFIELKNVLGEDGWLYGKADVFAFETFSSWIIVMKKELHALINSKLKDEVVDRPVQAIYKKYTREKYGKKDEMTLVKTLDLVAISFKILKKTI